MVAYRSKMVEPMELPDRETREQHLADAGYNVFNLPSDAVYIDLLTDSGTGTMSASQWGALMQGDEAYAGSDSFRDLQDAVQDVMGFQHVVPAHQGRGAENLLYGCLLEEGDVVPNNTHFDTTRAHVANQGARPVDCPHPDAHDPDATGAFKGNFDVEAAREVVDDVGADNVPAVVLTITNNSTAGQPVSVANTRDVAAFADDIDARLVVDACRFAENAHFVREREPEFEGEPVDAVAREQLSYADALVMSGKKEGLANIGGFTAVRDRDLFRDVKQRAILYEGFPTYGGMAGRDLAAMAVGLREAVTDRYVRSRVEQVQELAGLLDDADVPVYQPPGGHAVYLDASRLLPDVPRDQFPGQTTVCALYREGGVRGVELGSFAFPETDRPEYVRLALPRRTYHREHLDHVVDTAVAVRESRDSLDGLRIVDSHGMDELRHFSAELEPV